MSNTNKNILSDFNKNPELHLPIEENLLETIIGERTNLASPSPKGNLELFQDYKITRQNNLNEQISQLSSSVKVTANENTILRKSKCSLETELYRVKEENLKIISEMKTKNILMMKIQEKAKQLTGKVESWKIEREKNRKIIKEQEDIINELRGMITAQDNELNNLQVDLGKKEVISELNQPCFDEEVKRKLKEMKIDFNESVYSSNSVFFQFLLDELQVKIEENNTLQSKEMKEKMQSAEKFSSDNERLASELEKSKKNLGKEEENKAKLMEELSQLKGKIEWIKIIESENTKCKDMLKTLQNDLIKKNEIVAEMESFSDFFSTKHQTLKQKQTALIEGKDMTISDIRVLLLKFRADYKFIFENYKSLNQKYEKLKKEGVKPDPLSKIPPSQPKSADPTISVLDEEEEKMIEEPMKLDYSTILFGWEILTDSSQNKLKCKSRHTGIELEIDIQGGELVGIKFSDGLKVVLQGMPGILNRIDNLPFFFSNVELALNKVN